MRWTAHNVRLGEGEFGFGEPTVGAAELTAARLVQLTSDLVGPIAGLRVLDLACLEGLYGLEFAMHRADVLATEGREISATKVRHAAERLSPERFEIRVEDVRDLSLATHGPFDVVLCLGVLYHLEAADVVKLVESVSTCTKRMAIFRTAIGLSGDRVERLNGREYRGFTYPEARTNWSSIGNTTSFWPTRASLLNLVTDAGFTSVLEAVAPPILEIDGTPDGTFLVAMKGEPQDVFAAPPAAGSRYREGRWPEAHGLTRHPAQRGRVAQRLLPKRYWRERMRRS